jgi:hypothetical protein
VCRLGRWGISVFVIGMMIMLSACSGGSGQTGGASGSAAAETVKIFENGLTSPESDSLTRALDVLEQKCMAGYGFKFFITADSTTPGSAPASSRGSIPLTVDTSALRSNGYGLYAMVLASQAHGGKETPIDPQNTAYVNNLSTEQQTAYNQAMNGANPVTITMPDGKQSRFLLNGCYGKALTGLYGSAEEYEVTLLSALDAAHKIRTLASSSSGYQNALKEWSTCMAHHGYDFSSEATAQESVSDRYNTPDANLGAVHQYEMAVATQDAACVDSSHLNQAALSAVESAVGKTSSDEENNVLNWDLMLRKALTTASKIMAEG